MTQTSATTPTLARLTVKLKELSDPGIGSLFDPNPIFDKNAFRPDFYTKVRINGKTRERGTFKDATRVTETQLNFNPSEFVDPTLTRVPVRLDVMDADPFPFPDERADINPERGIFGLEMLYDVRTGELVSTSSGRIVGRENQLITTTGNGDDSAAQVKFVVEYDTFVTTSNLSDQTPIILGNSRSQILQGKDVGGIIDGRGGKDTISGMGGADVLLGGFGNDSIEGGTGNDILFGGAGRDSLTGGAGNDTFVLAPGTGTDVITDFQNGKDKLGLAIELDPAALDIVQQGKNTVIGVGSERLAVLSNVNANQITAADFVTVDFTQFKGMAVPSLLSQT